MIASTADIPKPDVLQYMSASRISCWQQCRLKFYFRYVQGIPSNPSPALFIGQAVHRVLQQWNLNRWRDEPATAEVLEPVFQSYWQSEQDPDLDWAGKEEQQKAKTWSMILHYLKTSPIPNDEKPEGVEVVIEEDLSEHDLPPLKGIIDLVRKGGRIVDFKTAGRLPSTALSHQQHGTQLGCYALLYRGATGQTESGFELQHLTKTKEPKLLVTTFEPLSPVATNRLLQIMHSYVRGVTSSDCVPSPGAQCAWCDYLKECTQWKGGDR